MYVITGIIGQVGEAMARALLFADDRRAGTLQIPVTCLRPALFMENSAWDVAEARDSGVIASFLQPLDKPVPMIATADIGRLAAQLIGGGDDHDQQ